MIEEILNLYKEVGETPLERLQRFRMTHPLYKDIPLAYLGRLDPMAEGVLLAASGDATKRKEQFLELPKTYDCEALFGVSSDSHDVLGIVENGVSALFPDSQDLKDYLTLFLGVREQTYPWYSSRTVSGVPMHTLARTLPKVELDAISRPTKTVEVFGFHLIETYPLTAKSLQDSIEGKIARVKGDFRQKETLAVWDKFFKRNKNTVFSVARLYVSCSSGTYVRSLVHDLGERLHCGALALSIVRRSVGPYTISESVRE